MTLPDLPDVEGMIIGAYAEHTEMAGIGVHSRPTRDEQGHLQALPFLVVRRFGGQAIDGRWLDSANLQVESWADDEVLAGDNARKARRILKELSGALPVSSPLGVLTGVREVTGLLQLDDPRTATPRYLFGVAARAHPLTEPEGS